ncbi:MAG: hypothetical protein ABIR79_15085 [Candidatus Binatia bacterium]
MRTLMKVGAMAAWLLVTVSRVSAVSPADEAAFLDAYRAAFAAKDTAKLAGFLYTKGADPMAVDFYKSMQTQDAGKPGAVITLEALTPKDKADAAKPKDGPGGPMVLPLVPTKKLLVAITTEDANGKSTSTSSCLVAESEGQLVIPVPGRAK